jgi:hypothetical protein
VLERDDDRARRVEDVPEHQLATIVEHAGRKQSRDVGADHLDPVPPAADLRGIRLDAKDVRQRDFDLTAERPELVQPLDVEYRAVALDCHVDHRFTPACR